MDQQPDSLLAGAFTSKDKLQIKVIYARKSEPLLCLALELYLTVK